ALDGVPGASRIDWGGDGQSCLRFSAKPEEAAPAQPAPILETPEIARQPASMPAQLRSPPPPAPPLPRPLAPSGVSALIEPDGALVDSGASPVLHATRNPAFALQRGTAIHRLLQVLPELEPDGREMAA